MKNLTKEQWNQIIQAVITMIVTVCNIILVSSCALSISGSILKNSSHSSSTNSQKTEQVVDSVQVNNNLTPIK